MRHADIVRNEWSASQQRRVGWISEDLESAHWLPDLHGTYVFITEFHEDDECLFKQQGDDVVKMRSVKVD